jgi:hypothetical protein
VGLPLLLPLSLLQVLLLLLAITATMVLAVRAL